jgi:hypothetical protein
MSKAKTSKKNGKTNGVADDPQLRKRVRKIADSYAEYGSGRMEAASNSLGVSREALSNYLALGPCRRGTYALLRANIDAAEKAAAEKAAD